MLYINILPPNLTFNNGLEIMVQQKEGDEQHERYLKQIPYTKQQTISKTGHSHVTLTAQYKE
jgi:hypothetical protein